MYYKVHGHPDGLAYLTEDNELKRWSLDESYYLVLTKKGAFVELRHWEIDDEAAHYCTTEKAIAHLGHLFFMEVPEEFRKVNLL